MLTKRGKACLILIFSAITNCQSMAYRSFKSESCSARGVRKVTTGITNRMWPGMDVSGMDSVCRRTSLVFPPIPTQSWLLAPHRDVRLVADKHQAGWNSEFWSLCFVIYGQRHKSVTAQLLWSVCNDSYNKNPPRSCQIQKSWEGFLDFSQECKSVRFTQGFLPRFLGRKQPIKSRIHIVLAANS